MSEIWREGGGEGLFLEGHIFGGAYYWKVIQCRNRLVNNNIVCY